MATLSPPSLHKQGSFTRTRQRTPSTSLRLTTELSPISSRERDNTYSHALGGGGGSSSALDYGGDGQGTTSSSSGSSMSGDASAGKRGRSSSILSMHEIKENYDDDLDQHALTNLNADWVNYKGAWLIHVVLIIIGKVVVDSLPGIEQDTSWTIVLQGYLIATYLIFHFVEGVPFESNSGVYDRLTMWEQIDNGAQYTPAKKWLTSLPIILFLLSTHYTRYTRHPALFSLNIVSLVGLALIPKLPQLHRQRITLGRQASEGTKGGRGDRTSGTNTPVEVSMARATLPSLAE